MAREVHVLNATDREAVEREVDIVEWSAPEIASSTLDGPTA